MAGEYELQNPSEVVFEMGDFNGHVGEEIEGFQGVRGGNGIGKRNAEGRMLLEFCDEKELCMVNTWFKKTDKRKITFKSGNNESEIDFILVSRENRKFLKDVKAIPWEFATSKKIPWELQHRMLVADVDKRKLNKVVQKESRVKRMVGKLKEREMQEKFERRVEELVDVETINLWESFRDGILMECDELCGKKKVRKNGGNKWWWNEEVRNVVVRKKEAFKTFRKTGLEDHKIFYRKMKNQTMKLIAKAMKTEAEKEMEKLREKPNKIFKFVKLMKRYGKDVEGGK